MASHRTQPRANAYPRSPIGTTRLWFSYLLCLCAWRGPMPIVHSHSLQSQVLAGNAHLAAHVASHHAHDIDHGGGGWHLHFVFPANGSDDVPADEDNAAPSLAWPTALLEQAGPAAGLDFAPAVTTDFDVDMVAIGKAGCPAWLSISGQRCAHAPPDVIPKRISPHAWLCIARC